jgi:hypothetical protein
MVSHISTIKRSVISGTVALALLGTSVAPALAWGQREQDFTKGALSVLLLGAIVNDARQHRAQEVHPRVYYPIETRPVYHTPVYQAPVQSYYATPAAQAFQSYTAGERRQIQAALANYGYYFGYVDGSFGPSTYRAITAFARESGQLAMLETRGGAYGLLDSLIY